MKTNEMVHFRYIVMPCCGTQLCWVNPRLPNYCPECSVLVFEKVKSAVVYEDTRAGISYNQWRPKVEEENKS